MANRLLDTDILSEIIKRKNAAVARNAATYLAQHGEFTTSAVSVAEIVHGFRRMGREERWGAATARLHRRRVYHPDEAARVRFGVGFAVAARSFP